MESYSFNLPMAILNFLLVAVGAIIADKEYRLTFGQMGPRSMPWVAHGGMWADLLILTPVIGLVMAKASTWSGKGVVACLFTCFIITIVCHIMWAKAQPVPGHIVDGGQIVQWGGYYHLIYMTLAMGIIVSYFVLTPHHINPWVTVLMTVFVVPAILQPGWIAAKVVHGRGTIDAMGWTAAAIIWLVIWATTLVRNHA